ncbi:LPXTG cell wall anchor domain-containing protein [Lactococcus petauri]|nr:LPXTG cell wall anchor domain-containing protein [Lactococcus petauri]
MNNTKLLSIIFSTGGENIKETITDSLPRTGEIGGLFGALGLANLILALTLWLKRRKVK